MGVFYKNLGDANYVWKPVSKKPLNDFLQHKLPWSILQPFWKRDFLINLNGFDETFLRLQDVELNTRALFSKEINYKLCNTQPDCFYRIDEARKNFNTLQFLTRWVESALKYYTKFYPQAKQIKTQNYLLGTIYETHLQIIYNYKHKQLNKVDFKFLENKLISKKTVLGLSSFKLYLFKVAGFYNLYCVRIPGINKILKHILIY